MPDLVNTPIGTTDNLQKRQAAYERMRVNKYRHPLDKTPFWAYWDSMKGVPGRGLSSNYHHLHKSTFRSDNRGYNYSYGDPKDPDSYAERFRTPSSRALAREITGRKHGELLDGEMAAHLSDSARTAMHRTPIIDNIRYSLGEMDPNDFMARQMADSRWVPDPAIYSKRQAANDYAVTNARYAGDFAGSFIGSVPEMLATAGALRLVGKGAGLVYRPLRNSIIAARRGVTPKVVNRAYKIRDAVSNRMSEAWRNLSFWNKAKTGAKQAIFPTAVYGTYAGFDVVRSRGAVNSNLRNAVNIAKTKLVPEDFERYAFELPVIGYERGTDGSPTPVRANYSDYYQHLRRTRGQEMADQFRDYHRNKALNSSSTQQE